MSYFQQMPKMLYPFYINRKTNKMVVVDITKNVRFMADILDRISIYDEYDMRDGETIEIVSERVYGSPLYHIWLMIFNQKFDYTNDYPLTAVELNQYVVELFGVGNEHEPHHYIDVNGFIVSGDQAFSIPVSNIEWVEAENEKKRRIKLINRNHLDEILSNYTALV